MHILFTTDGDCKYGSVHALLTLIRELKKLDTEIIISVVLISRSNKKNDFAALGCKVYQLPYEPFCQGYPDNKMKLPVKYVIRGAQYLFGRIFALRMLERKLDLSSVDLIHSNSSREDFGAVIAEKYKKPLIWHIRESGDRDFRLYSYRHDLISFMNAHAAVFIAISDHIREHWIEKGLSEKKFIRIYDGIDREMYEPVKCNDVLDRYVHQKCFRLVMMGAIYEGKGQWQIIQAISRLPSEYRNRLTLDIVGDGSYSYVKKMKRMTETFCLDKQIRFLGYQEDYYSQLAEYDCGIMCSKCEGFGLVTVEYMIAGLPVVASDTGANLEILENGVTGLFYHYPEVEDLRDKLIDMMTHRTWAKRMGIAAQKAAEKFSGKYNAVEILNLYKKIG